MDAQTEKKAIEERIGYKPLRERVLAPEKAAQLVTDGMRVATSGTPTSSYPISFFDALCDRAKRGDKFKIDILCTSPLAQDIDGRLAELGLMRRRIDHQSNPSLAKAINKGEVLYSDMGAVWMSLQLRAGIIEGPDLAIIEATEITDKGFIVPSLLIADVPTVLQSSKKIIVEINTNIPRELRGIHDIYIPDNPPNRAPIPLNHTWERIGTPYIEVDPERIVGVIISDKKASPPSRPPMNETTKKLAKNVVDFIRAEVEKKKVPPGLLPFQIGLGGLGGAILNELDLAGFEGIEVHSALLDDSILDLIDRGKIKAVSGCGCYFTGDGLQRFFKDIKKYKEKIILRPMEVVNSPEVIQRLGVIALNTAIELDIYGHVNNSHIGGTHIVAGPSGSIETARNGYISIFMAPSTAKDGNVSAVVPMVPHVDHTEHEVNVVATENGLADLRGLDPKERAREIIGQCAHPDYRPLLSEYLREAAAKGGHEPHVLSKAFDFHRRLAEKGTMKDTAGKPS